MSETIKVVARSKSVTCLKLFMDNAAYRLLSDRAARSGLSALNLVRALLADRFPELPTQDLLIGGFPPKPWTDNREQSTCLKCGDSWGDHNADARAGDELPQGGPCVGCGNCERFV